MSEQGAIVGVQSSYKEAYDQLADYDVLVVLGGNSEATLKEKAEPLKIIKAYSDLQMQDTARERTVLSICTGSLFLAEQGILSGLAATTHPDYLTAFENICSHSSVRDGTDRTDVDEVARYVVNNLRFELGDEDENPYIRRKSDAGQRPSAGARYIVLTHIDHIELLLILVKQKGKHLIQRHVSPRIRCSPRSNETGWPSSHHEWGINCWH